MKARKTTTDYSNPEYDKSSVDLESAKADDCQEDLVKSSYQSQSLGKFLLKIGSDFLFYAGAWCCALWLLYLCSQFVHGRGASIAAREVRASWNRLLVDEQTNHSALVSGYIDTINMPHLLPSEQEISPPYHVYTPQVPPPALTVVSPKIGPDHSQLTAVNETIKEPTNEIEPQIQSSSPLLHTEVERVSIYETKSTSNDDYCQALKLRHSVTPGQSWGTLTKKQQSAWMQHRCDQYYCKPNRMEGRGAYKCSPLSP